jgi:hypothetical protein
MPSRFVCIDFEASGLEPKSFPTEIGLSDPVTGAVWSRLIRPYPVWSAEGEWNPASEAVTGISRAMLAADGLDPLSVYTEALTVIAGRDVVSDSPGFDGKWFAALVAAAVYGTDGAGEAPPPLQDLIKVAWKLAADRGRRPDIAWQKTELEACLRFPMTHRAGPDARHNVELLRLVAVA